MRIACAFADGSAAAWAAELAAALPDATVQVWVEGDTASAAVAAAPCDYAVVWKPPQAFVDAQPALKAIFNAGAGVDALAALRVPGHVPVVRLEDAGMAAQMADYVLHAVLHHYREMDVYAAQAATATWAPRPPRRKADHPVGLLGHGVLGQAVARALVAAGFSVAAWARTPQPGAALRVYAGEAEKQAFLAASRILVCLLPLTADTQHVVDAAALAALQPGGVVVNVARGGHVDAVALLDALDSGRLQGATLDVFADEPLPAASRLWTHPRVRVTPHISAATLRAEAIAQIVAKVRALERGEPVSGVVERGRGY